MNFIYFVKIDTDEALIIFVRLSLGLEDSEKTRYECDPEKVNFVEDPADLFGNEPDDFRQYIVEQ